MFEDLLSKLRDLSRRAEQLNGEHRVPLNELFPDEFLLRHTEFPSFSQLLSASGFVVENPEDFAAIPADQWNAFVRSRTRFSSWDEMLREATKDWATRAMEGN